MCQDGAPVAFSKARRKRTSPRRTCPFSHRFMPSAFRFAVEEEGSAPDCASTRCASSRQKERLSDVTITGEDDLVDGKKCQPNGRPVGKC